MFGGPSIVDVEASIAVVGEAGSEAMLGGEFPNRVSFLAADAGDPTGAELHRHAAELLLADPAADAVRRLENHQVLYAFLGEHLRRRDTLKSKINSINQRIMRFEIICDWMK